jgi:hypothetical protein
MDHRDIITDMYPVFARNQVFKKNYQKQDAKFPMFTDVAECEIELDENISEIIDFTRVSHSIDQQSRIHLLCRTKEKEQVVC